ncbi:hypothetical protein KC865_03535 [Candidatus Kaiserbacteria bacterium]|nr:hypothetical protein [Candidatus Kaiserbacteria bacterium]USN92529.1 MAG: hypothetical protein H6782_01805 [Candidatus Nomurabacteria bacterium]
MKVHSANLSDGTNEYFFLVSYTPNACGESQAITGSFNKVLDLFKEEREYQGFWSSIIFPQTWGIVRLHDRSYVLAEPVSKEMMKEILEAINSF